MDTATPIPDLVAGQDEMTVSYTFRRTDPPGTDPKIDDAPFLAAARAFRAAGVDALGGVDVVTSYVRTTIRNSETEELGPFDLDDVPEDEPDPEA